MSQEARDKIVSLMPSEKELSVLSALTTKILSILNALSNVVQMDRPLSLGYFIVSLAFAIRVLRRQRDAVSDSDRDSVIAEVSGIFYSELMKRFEAWFEQDSLCMLAALLMPQFNRVEWVCLETFREVDTKGLKEKLWEELARFCSKFMKKFNSSSHDHLVSSTSDQSIDRNDTSSTAFSSTLSALLQIDDSSSPENCSSSSFNVLRDQIRAEIGRYRNTLVNCHEKMTFRYHTWWYDIGKVSFPNLFQVYKYLCVVQVGSVAVERTNSDVKDILTKKRYCLQGTKVNALLEIRHNRPWKQKTLFQPASSHDISHKNH